MRPGRVRAYDSVAWCYDELARFYSRNRIRDAKRCHLGWLNKGDRVLYPGVGRGAEALEAAALGARVVGLDRSPAMLSRFERGIEAQGLDARTLEEDLVTSEAAEPYDAVALHFVLNVFREEEATEVLRRAASWVRPGGHVFVADFAPPPDSGWGRWVSWAHYAPVAAAGWLLGLAPLHRIHDYAEAAMRCEGELERVDRQRFSLRPGGTPCYEFLAFRRTS